MSATTDSSLLPRDQKRHRVYGGLTERQEHIFTWVAVCVVLFFITAWVQGIADLRRQQIEILKAAKAAGVRNPTAPPLAPAAPSRQIANAILNPDQPTTAFINDAMMNFVDPLRGASGKVRFTTKTPGATVAKGPGGTQAVFTEDGDTVEVSPSFTAPSDPGVYQLAVKLNEATREVDNFNVITLVPFAEKRAGRIGLYYLGNWPFESGAKPKTEAYANPSGFIEVTQENADTQVSEHFKLRDFLTKDQPNVWPKYLLLNPKLLDKLELTIAELEAMGHPVRHVTVMSGFRTPRYNVSGGNTQGRANLSRHMYGDASDIFIDNDRNGQMDDLNGDGRVDERDSEVVLQAAERVERNNPQLVGGVGVYSACCGHGPFTHIDVRGFRARWRGTGNG